MARCRIAHRSYAFFVGGLIAFNLFIPVRAEPKVDFNADGRADIFLRNPFTGEMSAWLTDGSSVIQRISYGKQPPSSGWTPIALDDFNGDGRTDLLWYHNTNRELRATLLSEGGILQTVDYGQAEDPAAGWAASALNDFNGDGRADLLWFNTRSGALLAWMLSENGILQTVNYPAVPISDGWTPAAVDDFNGDGRGDVLGYNIMTRALSAWFLSEGGVIGEVGYGTAGDPSAGWTAIALDDVNGDGRADLLWYNNRTGQLMVWLLNENGVLQTVDYPTVDISAGWKPAAVDDFNGDSRADVLWYNIMTRVIHASFLSEGGVIGEVGYGTAEDPSSGWSAVGVDDFNGDGRTDLLWRNFFDNRIKGWLLGDSDILDAPFYGEVEPSTVWLLEIPN